jgi:hypothetical protein
LPAKQPGKREKRFSRGDCAIRQRAKIQIGACALIGEITGWVQVLQRGLRRVGHAGQSAAKRHSKNVGAFPCQKCNQKAN